MKIGSVILLIYEPIHMHNLVVMKLLSLEHRVEEDVDIHCFTDFFFSSLCCCINCFEALLRTYSKPSLFDFKFYNFYII